MRVLLVLIVLVFPIIETWALILLALQFGVWVLPYLAITAVLGIAIIRSERTRLSPRLSAMLASGARPLPALIYTFRRLVAGILLVLPGVLSDIMAVILLLLPDRAAANDDHAGPQVIEGEFHEVKPKAKPVPAISQAELEKQMEDDIANDRLP